MVQNAKNNRMQPALEMLFKTGRNEKASDIHISEGMPLMFRIDGSLQEIVGLLDALPPIREDVPTTFEPSDIAGRLILSMMNEDQVRELEQDIDQDFALALADGRRQRVNVFQQQGRLAATIRLLNDKIPSLADLKLPKVLGKLAAEPRGLILVTGPTGSGKSTTLAAMIDQINETRACHIITIEDPVEYVYTGKKALVHQRELGRDTRGFAHSLRSALREDPDVILVGEMRDYETVMAALTAAETGHLVLSTLHTSGAAKTIDRVIDACPAGSQSQVRTQLAGVLKGVITQCLIPKVSGGRCAATEIMVATDAVSNMIRENKCHQLGSVMQSGAALGMHSLNGDLSRLVMEGSILAEEAYKFTDDKKDLEQYLQ